MSYIRFAHPMKYVKGYSDDYVYTCDGSDGPYIHDHGNITDEGLIEILFNFWRTDNNLLKNHILKLLAKRLNVELREKPLTDDEYLEWIIRIDREYGNIKKEKKT